MIRTRFAPPLSGHLSVGNARIALANFLHARRHDGRIVLRLDDLDRERAQPELIDAATTDLRWLGIECDEVIRQSERLPRYAAAIEHLKQRGRLYPCFESEEELRAKREYRRKRGEPGVYDRAMLKLTPAQRESALASGKRPYWRFRLSDGDVAWGDMVLGRRTVKLSAVSDPVVIGADTTPLPALTAAVDDIAAGVTDLIRNESQVVATGVLLDIMAALGAESRPRLAHLPPVTDAGENRIARRVDARTLRSLRRDGVEPRALVAYIARLGTSQPIEPLSLERLVETFDVTRFADRPLRFEAATMLALNRSVLGETDFATVAHRLPGGATEAFWLAVRGNLDLLNEARGWWDVVAGTIVPPEIEERALLITALALLPPEPWHGSVWQDWTDALASATGLHDCSLSDPLRLALTGEDRGPELHDLLPLIGRARAANRLQVAAAGS
ncbi:MAG TPA: glutamate--tRNA ligase family protein [Acetobacteraceae bacterium]|jgi:glutamyl-tRNA synthetase